MDTVQALHDDAERHLNDCEDHSQLHLEVVGEGEELVAKGPHWIKSNWINAIRQLVQIRSVYTGRRLGEIAKGIITTSVAVKRL